MISSISRAATAAFLLAASGATFAAQEVDPSAQCSIDLATKSEFSHLADKLPLGDGDAPTFAMLANDNVPTAQEREEIAAWFAGREACKQVGASFRQSHYPLEVNNQLDITLTAINEIGVELYKGRITYGEANRRITAQYQDLMVKATAIIQQYKKEIEASRAEATQAQAQAQDRRLQAANQESHAAAQAEEQRRQRLQMIFNYLQANRVQIAPPPQLRSPAGVTTNCSTVGGQTNCYTH
jgi:hypothetical protein